MRTVNLTVGYRFPISNDFADEMAIADAEQSEDSEQDDFQDVKSKSTFSNPFNF